MIGEASRTQALTSKVLRYKFLDLWPCTPTQQRHLERSLGLAQDVVGTQVSVAGRQVVVPQACVQAGARRVQGGGGP